MSAVEPKVAVIMASYNEGPYIGASVRSILAQTRADLIDSIVIADDGSKPATLAVLRDIESWDPRIRVLYGPGGAGPSQRNLAVQHTSTPILALLDGDDLWTPDKLAKQLPALSSDPDVGLVYSGYFTFAANDLATAHRAAVRDITAARDLSCAYFTNDPPVITSTTLIRRRCFDACGGFDPALRVFEDTDLFQRLARICRFAFVEAPLLYKRNRTTSITGGRTDLMAHHAFVALRAAAAEPRLLAFVPARLSERARKLGNQRFLLGDVAGARLLLRFATRQSAFNWRAWASLVVATCFAKPMHRFMATQWRSRRAALGVVEP